MKESEKSTEHIGRTSAKGIAALASRTFVLNLISFATSLVIFTILAPRDVGIYTAVIAIQRIISFFTDFGFGAALVQKKEEITASDTKTTFTLQSTATFLVFILVFIFKDSIAHQFKFGEDATVLLLALVFTIFLSSFKTIPSIILERKIHFHKLILPQIIESLVFNGVLLLLVLNHFGLYSFSYAFLLSSIVGIPIYYFIQPWNIKLGIDRRALAHLRFGLQFQLKNILATIKDDFLTVILTWFLSFTQIGYIGFAQRLAFFVFRYVVDSVTRVTFSAYARLQDDATLLRKAIEKSLFFVAAIMFPMLTGLIIAAPLFISYFPKWHNKWEPAVVSLVFFGLNAMVSSLSGILVNVLDSTGRVKTTLKLMVIWTALTWILTPLFIYFWGYNGVSVASFAVTLTICYTVYLVKKVVEFSFFGSILKPIFATSVMAVLFYAATILFVSDMATLLISVFVSGIVYSVIFYVLAGSELRHDMKKILLK
jgi:O-antigen/teichoic acid export membrane protein